MSRINAKNTRINAEKQAELYALWLIKTGSKKVTLYDGAGRISREVIMHRRPKIDVDLV